MPGPDQTQRRNVLLRNILKGNRRNRSIRKWNSLSDRLRQGGKPPRVYRRLRRRLPGEYDIKEDLTVGIPHTFGPRPSGVYQGAKDV